MAAKPTVSNAILRRKIREVLAMAPGYGKTHAMLLDCVNELTGGGVGAEQLDEEIEWNHFNDFIRAETNEDTDELEWFITPHGQAKQKSLT